MEQNFKELGNFLNKAPCGIGVFNKDTSEAEYLNDSYFKITGYSRDEYEEVKDRTVASLLYSDVLTVGETLTNGQSFEYKFRFMRKNGDIIWIKTNVSIINYMGEEKVLASFVDITKDIDEADKLNFIAESIESGISIFTFSKDSLELEMANEFFYKIFNVTESEFKNSYNELINNSVSKNDYRRVTRAIIESVKNNKPIILEHSFRDAKGKSKYIRQRIVTKRLDKEGYYRYISVINDITEEVATKLELERNRELLDSAMDSLDMIVWEYDIFSKNLKIINSNSTYGRVNRIFGNFPQCIIEKNQMHPDSVDDYLKFFKDFEEKKCVLSGEHLAKGINGEFWWQKNTITPVFNEEGYLISGMGTTINITEKKEIEKQYQTQVLAMENSDKKNMIAKSITNLNANETRFIQIESENAMDITTDISYDEGLKLIVNSVVLDEEREKVESIFSRKNIIEKSNKNIVEDSCVYRRWSKDKSIIWCETRYILTEEPNTHNHILFLYSYDVTYNVLEEKLITKIADIEYDALGVIDVQSGLYKIVYSKGKRQHKNIEFAGDYKKTFMKLVANQSSGIDDTFSIYNFKFENILKELSVNDNYVIAYSTKMDDKSYRKRIQFTYLDDSKESIVFARSDISDLYKQQQEQLRITEDALKQAKEAQKARTDFFSRMSHDMRTPMNGIIGMTRLAKSTDDIDEIKHNLDLIESSGKYMTNLVNDILDLQKMETGKLKLKGKLIRCDLFIETIVDMMRPTAARKNIIFNLINRNVNLDQYAILDAVRSQQIFVNVMSNAVKFTPKGGNITVTMETLFKEGNIEHDKFEIIDNGIGMSKEFLENELFNAYSQEHNSTTTKYTGSGLGMAITKHLMDLIGGRIEVESDKDIGTKVTLYIDVRVMDNETAEKKLSSKKEIKSSQLGKLKGKNILVCEDHPINAEITRKILEKQGCNVIHAKDGREGVNIFAQSEDSYFDAVLMDIRMPILDGWDATKEIRSLFRNDSKDIPIIAMTANAFDDDIKKSMRRGMNAHLAKPINPEKVYETLLQFMDE